MVAAAGTWWQPTEALLAALRCERPAVLAWIGLAALPWLIERWARRRQRETPWAAVGLLGEALRHSAPAVQRQRRLLLALRSLLAATAVAAAARPWRDATPSTPPPAAPAAWNLFFVDCSFSMSADGGEGTRLQRARRLCRDAIAQLPAGSPVAVVAWGAPPLLLTPAREFDRAAQLRAVEALQIRPAPADLDEALRFAERLIDEFSSPEPALRRVRVVLVSDATRTTWDAWSPVRSGAPPTAAAAAWERLARRAGIEVVAVDDSCRFNAAVTDLRAPPQDAVPGRNAAWTAVVRAWGLPDRGPPAAVLEFRVDGAAVAEQAVVVRDDAPVEVGCSWTPAAAGTFVVEARLRADGDALAADDSRWALCEVRSPPRVAVFEGRAGAGREWAAALQPESRPEAPTPLPERAAETQAAASSDVAVVDRRPVARLAESLGDVWDLVLLADVPQLTAGEARMLGRYVAEGGAAWAAWGAHAAAAPGPWQAADGVTADWLPAARDGPPRSGSWTLAATAPPHPVLEAFGDRPQRALRGVAVQRFFPLRIDDRPEKQARVLLSTHEGAPVAVLGRYGRGTTAAWAFSPELRLVDAAPWSNLALSPSFLPLVREMLAAAVRPSTHAAVTVGRQLAVAWPGRVGDGRSWCWRLPDGAWESATPRAWDAAAGDAILATPIVAEQPGPYALRECGQERGDAVQAVANVETREGDLAPVDGTTRDALAKWRGAAPDAAAGPARNPVGAWWASLAIGAACGEAAWACWLGRRRA